MQTFLPYPSFSDSAKVLDRQRLGKQRVENMQIIKALLDPDYGWQNHPAVKMWRGHVNALYLYQQCIVNEWTGRGYKDTCLTKTYELIKSYDAYADPFSFLLAHNVKNPYYPIWIGDPDFHRSHQSNLLRKDFDYYSQFFRGVPDNLEYVWPV